MWLKFWEMFKHFEIKYVNLTINKIWLLPNFHSQNNPNGFSLTLNDNQ